MDDVVRRLRSRLTTIFEHAERHTAVCFVRPVPSVLELCSSERYFYSVREVEN